MARSDVPGHEGPTHHGVTELWTYEFPLTDTDGQRLIADLSAIPPLMRQAQKNLVGNSRELWIAGIRNIPIAARRPRRDRPTRRLRGQRRAPFRISRMQVCYGRSRRLARIRGAA